MKNFSCESIARTNPSSGSSAGGRCDSVASHRRRLLDELSVKGIRITAQRRAVIDAIQQAQAHLDAASLLAEARERAPNIDRATVYRTIDLLKKMGLIDELDLMHLEGEKHFYEVKTRKEHIHLACFQCGRIEEFSEPLFERLKEEIREQAGFRVRVARLEIGGTCSACAAKETGLEEGKSERYGSRQLVTE